MAEPVPSPARGQEQRPPGPTHKAFAALDPAGVQVSIIDAEGSLVYSSVDPSARRLDLSDREHFRTHLGGVDALFVSRPVKGVAIGRSHDEILKPYLRQQKLDPTTPCAQVSQKHSVIIG